VLIRIVRKLGAVGAEEARMLRARGRMLLVMPVIHLLPNQTLVRVRTALYRFGGVATGDGAAILGTVRIWGPGRLTLGARTTINAPCVISLEADVTLGSGVLIAHDAVLTTGSHAIGPSTERGGPVEPRAIVVGDGVWVGAGAIILPGVRIGAGSVVGAGAVVTKDVPPNSVVAGVPARVLRTLSEAAGG
jgi:maltose O-acetyltransferase